MSAPLVGVRVLDLSRLLPGAFCSLVLADLGADVIKIEDPAVGDYLRWLPPLIDVAAPGSPPERVNAYFLHLNRGKRSACLDLRQPDGRAAFLALVGQADVVLDGFRAGVMERLDLGPRELRRANPRLVVASVSGYGHFGPLANRAGHDLNFLARSGLLRTLSPDAVPQPPPMQWGDIAAGGLVTAIAIVAQLLARERGGRAATEELAPIDVAMLDGLLYLQLVQLAEAHAASSPAGGADAVRSAFPLSGELACYRVYATQDGEAMALAALEPKFWQSFCQAVNRPDWVPVQMAQGAAQERLINDVAALFAQRTRAEWEALAAGLDACLEPVLGLAEARDQPQLCARGFVNRVGPLQVARFPVAAVSPPGTALALAPRFGQHTREVLREAGLAEDWVRELIERGVARAT